MTIRWRVYRLDDPSRVYLVYSHDRDSAIRTAQIEHFGLTLARHMLGAARA